MYPGYDVVVAGVAMRRRIDGVAVAVMSYYAIRSYVNIINSYWWRGRSNVATVKHVK